VTSKTVGTQHKPHKGVQISGGPVVPRHPVTHKHHPAARHKHQQPKPKHQHHQHHAAHHPKQGRQKRGWTPSADADCCVAEALAVFGIPFEQDEPVFIADALTASYPVFTERSPLDLLSPAAGLILGVALPEPHAVAVDLNGIWWSWGEPFNPAEWPELVIEEVWAL
jgi:hypothetical protein